MAALVVAIMVTAAAPSVDELVAWGIPTERAVVAFAVTPELQRGAHELVNKRSRDSAAVSTRARAIYDGLRALVSGGVIVADRDNRPKPRAPLTAAQLWSAAQHDDHPTVGCYELTALFIAMARSQGIDAVGAEPVVPLGAGETGHVLAVVLDARGGRTKVDLQNGGFMRDHGTRELTDRELVAHFYNLRAVAAIVANDPSSGERALADGFVAAPLLPELHANRAALDAFAGHFESALRHADTAAQARPEIPYFQYQAGVVALQAGEQCRGLAALRRALQLLPSYDAARKLARQTLERNESLRCP